MNENFKLFDEFERTNAAPAKYEEPLFDALNRLSWNNAAVIRATLEDWFCVYPETNKRDLSSRFRSQRDSNHQGAFFELVLFKLLTELGYQIKLNHPTPSGTPDFLARTSSGEQFFLDATIAQPKTFRDSPSEKVVFEALNKLDCSDFSLCIRTRGVLKNIPPKNKIQQIQDWVYSLDYERIRTDLTTGLHLPEYRFEHGGWTLIIEALPRSPDKRGTKPHRPIGIGPMRVDFVDSVKPIVEAVRAKAHKYRGLGDPFVVAVNALDLAGAERIDVLLALFGYEASTEDPNISRVRSPQGINRDHVWHTKKNTGVSAVLLFNELQHANLTSATFCMYENPWASYPVPVSLRRLPHSLVDGDFIKWYRGQALGAVLGLSPGWPGPK
ncbi:MAG: hypothetical protein HYX84_03490 [Chloroflexi bacterium]|nr:hypothetical protein [Chloroflexota bacterium]